MQSFVHESAWVIQSTWWLVFVSLCPYTYLFASVLTYSDSDTPLTVFERSICLSVCDRVQAYDKKKKQIHKVDFVRLLLFLLCNPIIFFISFLCSPKKLEENNQNVVDYWKGKQTKIFCFSFRKYRAVQSSLPPPPQVVCANHRKSRWNGNFGRNQMMNFTHKKWKQIAVKHNFIRFLKVSRTNLRAIGCLNRFQCANASTGPSSGPSFGLSEVQLEFQDVARKFAREEIIPVAAELDKTGAYPMDIVKKAHSIGLLNSHIPADLGGLDLDILTGCIIAEELAYGCTGVKTALEGSGLGVSNNSNTTFKLLRHKISV